MSLQWQMVLGAGLALSGWVLELRRLAAPLADLHYTCAWASDFTTMQLRLGDQPLLGNSLTSLAGLTYRLKEEEAAVSEKVKKEVLGPTWTSKRQRMMPNFPDSLGQRSIDQRSVKAREPSQTLQPQEKSRVPRPKIEIDKLPLKAEPVLLFRLAGESGLYLGNARDRQPITEYGSRSAFEQANIANRGKTKTFPVQPTVSRAQHFQRDQGGPIEARAVPGKAAELQTWTAKMANQVIQAFHQHELSGDLLIPDFVFSLSRQWATRVSGPAAPSRLLLWLAGLSQTGSGMRHREDGGIGPSPEKEKRPQELTIVDEQRTVKKSVSTMAESVSSRIRGQEVALSEEMAGPASLQTPWGGRGSLKLTLKEPADLPPLLPAQTVEMTVPPLAANTASEGVWSEAHTIEEGLDLLAQKIKRILAEEARRHGIDV